MVSPAAQCLYIKKQPLIKNDEYEYKDRCLKYANLHYQLNHYHLNQNQPRLLKIKIITTGNINIKPIAI